jgi:hypothetical protein
MGEMRLTLEEFDNSIRHKYTYIEVNEVRLLVLPENKDLLKTLLGDTVTSCTWIYEWDKYSDPEKTRTNWSRKKSMISGKELKKC